MANTFASHFYPANVHIWKRHPFAMFFYPKKAQKAHVSSNQNAFVDNEDDVAEKMHISKFFAGDVSGIFFSFGN